MILPAILWSQSCDLPVFRLTLLRITCNCDLWKSPRLDKIRYNHTFLSTMSLKIDFLFVTSAPIHCSNFPWIIATSSFWRGVLPQPEPLESPPLLLLLYSESDMTEVEPFLQFLSSGAHTRLLIKGPTVTSFPCHRDPWSSLPIYVQIQHGTWGLFGKVLGIFANVIPYMERSISSGSIFTTLIHLSQDLIPYFARFHLYLKIVPN